MLDLDELESTSAFTGVSSQAAFPFIVDGYETDSLNPDDHHFKVRRADPLDDPLRPARLFLDPKDPMADNPDPTKRRPPISSFEFRPYADAYRKKDVDAIKSFEQDNRTKTFTEPGGLVLADGVVVTESGDYIARWIRPLRQSDADNFHRVIIGWATLRPRPRGGVDVEILNVEEAEIVRNIDELREAILRWFNSDNHFSGATLGVYLRLLTTQPDNSVKVTIPGSTAPGGGRIDLRDKKVGEQYVPRTPDEGIGEFLASPLGKKLDAAWGNTVIEVIPVLSVQYGSNSLEKRSPVDAYAIPAALLKSPPTGQDKIPATMDLGFSYSTVRVSAVLNEDRTAIKFHVVSLASPINGDLYRLADVHSKHHAPDAAPIFPIFTKKERAAPVAIGAPLEGGFRV